MDQRNTLCSHQMLNLQPDQGFNHFHPNHGILSGKIADYPNQSIQPGLSASRFYGNQYNSFQNLHAVPNLGPSGAAPSNFYTRCMFPLSSSFVPLNLNKFDRENQFVDCNRGFGKRKTAELPPVNQHNVNESASSGVSSSSHSLNCGLPQWELLYKEGLNLTDCTIFVHPEYQQKGNINSAEGSYKRVSRSNLFSLQPDSAYFPDPNYVVQTSHMGQPFHPANSIWMAQFAVENCNHQITNLQGTFEMTNMGAPAFPDAPSRLNAPVLINATPLPNLHQHMSPAHAMQLQSYGPQVQMQATSYPHPLNNLHPIGVYHFTGGQNSDSRLSNFCSNGEQTCRYLQIHSAAPDFSSGSVRTLSNEDVAVMDIRGFHGGEDAIDQHQDMRLDVDEMSYEELLALEEQIGAVKTGLTEEYINKNIKTGAHHSQTTCLPSDESLRFSPENEACIICQVEYKEDEVIGTLDCGHSYHGECIKQWLLVKNLCPICKKTALAKDDSER